MNISDTIKNKMEDQGIKKEEILSIIDNAEKTNHKFCLKDNSKYLAKSEFKNLTIYVEYNKSEIINIYSHKMNIVGITGDVNEPVNFDDTTEWNCCYCNKPAVFRNIDLKYYGIVKPGPGIVCTTCLDSYITEGIAKTIKKAEDTVEEKRG